jgi:hypothetical protein
MGGHAYWYFVTYQADLQSALDALREREFRAGRYNPVIRLLPFGRPDFLTMAPGPKHRTIQEAFDASAEDGTRSILDITRVGANPGLQVAAPFPEEIVREATGFARPTRAHVSEIALSALLESIEDRGQCFYLTMYDAERPSELLFAGYSFD